MDADQVKKYVAIAAAGIPILVGLGTVANKYLDQEFVSHAEYDERQQKQELLLQALRVDSALQILENRKMILEERLRTLNQDAASRARTERDLLAVIQSQAEWRKQKNTPQ